MPSVEISEYFKATEFRDTREDLKLGISLVDGPRTSIDCGCGAGSDIAFLRANGFAVHAFDIEPEAVARCQNRFSGDDQVSLSQDSFGTFHYPRASLVVADASLFSVPKKSSLTFGRRSARHYFQAVFLLALFWARKIPWQVPGMIEVPFGRTCWSPRSIW